jgi:hypothetical protein
MDMQLDLLGEPLIPELKNSCQLRGSMNMDLLKYQDLTPEGRDYNVDYSDP